MRCVAAVALISLLCATTASGIGITEKGVKVGLNIAAVYGEDVPSEFESKMGLCCGVFVTIGINRILGIQPEVLYSMKGAQYELEFVDPYGNPHRGYHRFFLDYLEIPMLVRVAVPISDELNISSFVGPYGGIKIASIRRFDPPAGYDYYEQTGLPPPRGKLQDIGRLDFGVVLGAGFDVALGPGDVRCEARYALGLTDVHEEWNWWLLGRNRVFTVTLGYCW